MKTLIVGCGYIGLLIGEELARQGHKVSGLRRTAASDTAAIAAGITPLSADVTRPETLRTLPTDFDSVVYCASSSGGGPEDYRRVYVEGIRNVLEWLSASQLHRFVYTSSTSVYGQTSGEWVDESTPTAPLAETAQVLLSSETLLFEASSLRKLSAVVLRVAGIYGPGRGHWLQQFLKGAATIQGHGERWLNLVHRDDAVNAVIASLHSTRPKTLYNVVDDEPVTQLALFEWFSRKLSRSLPPSVSEHSNSKRGFTSKRVSNRRLRSDLGFQLKYPTFREGFAAELERIGILKSESSGRS